MSSVGVKIDQFDVPVCNSFQATVLNDQLCYEVDLNRFSNIDNFDRELDLGFYFIMDYNEDRQTLEENNNTEKTENRLTMATNILNSDSHQHASIHLNTIGKSIA